VAGLVDEEREAAEAEVEADVEADAEGDAQVEIADSVLSPESSERFDETAGVGAEGGGGGRAEEGEAEEGGRDWHRQELGRSSTNLFTMSSSLLASGVCCSRIPLVVLVQQTKLTKQSTARRSDSLSNAPRSSACMFRHAYVVSERMCE
jgi:hypothetical protein